MVRKLVPSFLLHFDEHHKDVYGQRRMANGFEHTTIDQAVENLVKYIGKHGLASCQEVKARCYQRVAYAKRANTGLNSMNWNIFQSDEQAVTDAEVEKQAMEETVALAITEVRNEVQAGTLTMEQLMADSKAFRAHIHHATADLGKNQEK